MVEENKKALPLGEDDFRTVIEENNYDVDKTLRVKNFLDYKNKVALITRPRRFGITLNMTGLAKGKRNHECKPSCDTRSFS